jgi:hypothetical protein
VAEERREESGAGRRSLVFVFPSFVLLYFLHFLVPVQFVQNGQVKSPGLPKRKTHAMQDAR